MKKLSFQYVVILFLTAVFCVSLHVQPQTASAQEDSSQQRLVDRAENTFNDFMGDEKMTWLQRNYPDAKGLIIIPRQLKGGFLIGGSRGSGVLVVRNHETGQWSQPGFYTVSSLSLGPQIGGQAAGVMMIVRTERALTKLFRSSVKLGGDTSVALGPVGVGVRSAVTADIVTFARSRGAYVGVSLQGSMIRVRSGWNEAYFGRPVRPVDIFVKENVRNPGADKLIRTISETELKVQR